MFAEGWIFGKAAACPGVFPEFWKIFPVASRHSQKRLVRSWDACPLRVGAFVS